MLNDLADRLDLGQIDLDLAIESATLGDAAMKVTWNAAERRPAVAAVHPGTLGVVGADDPRQLLRIEQRYRLDREDAQSLFSADAALLAGERIEVRELWTNDRSAGTSRRPGDPRRGQSLRVDSRSADTKLDSLPCASQLWGISDLEDLSAICQELNRRMSVLGKAGPFRRADRGAGKCRQRRGDRGWPRCDLEPPEGAKKRTRSICSAAVALGCMLSM